MKSEQEGRALQAPILTFKMPSMDYDLTVHDDKEVREALQTIFATSGFSEKRLTHELGKLSTNGTAIYILDLQ